MFVALRWMDAHAKCSLRHLCNKYRRVDVSPAASRRENGFGTTMLRRMTLHEQLQSGVSHHQAGRFAQAEAIYRQILSRDPNHVGAMILLGTLAVQAGRLDAGMELLRRAIKCNPGYANAHYNLGIALKANGQGEEAIAAYRQAIRLSPDFADSHNNLGIALCDKGQLDEAITSYRQAIRLKPGYIESHYNLGIALYAKGRFDEAIASYRQAIRLKPDFAPAHTDLGNALAKVGQIDAAIASYRVAIGFKPDYADAYYNLGIALQGNGQLDEAVAAHEQAVELQPAFAGAYNNLGNALKSIGQLDQAIDAFRHAILLRPEFAEAHSNLVFTLNYHPGCDSRRIQGEFRLWNQRHAEPLKKFIQPFTNDRDPERRLRIGYVSPDFCQHVVGRNLLPLLSHHDHGQMEIFCYPSVVREDGLTQRFRGFADVWRSILELSDSQAADLIRQDRIDILVDLSLHTAGNRLGMFARKPAPVQATFAGYPGSTGLETIDYRLTDPHLDPPGLNDPFYSERSYQLPDSFWCYDPPVAELPIDTLPAQSNDFLTFGCLNNFCKINEQVIQLWAQILKAVSNSRLLLMAPRGSSRERLLSRLSDEGIGPQRVDFVAKQSRSEYLKTFNRIDIGLDTLPYNGHTTSLDSFWMGVPVITLVGHTVVGRAGLSQLTNLGLPELIARAREQYVQIATAMAGNLPRLAELRRTIRARMMASALCDGEKFARSVESAFRAMWRQWCADPNR
jgi:protein O-GlcNAc transferase